MSRTTVDRVRHAEQVVAVRARGGHELGMGVEQPGELVAVVCLDGAVGEHERRRRLRRRRGAPRRGGGGGPGRKAVALGEVAPGLGDRDAVHGRDPVRAALVVLDVGVERLLGAEPLDVLLEPWPARRSRAAARARAGRRPASPAGRPSRRARASSLACLRSCSRFSGVFTTGSFPRPVVRRSGRKEARGSGDGGVGSALSADWTRPRPARAILGERQSGLRPLGSPGCGSRSTR